MNITDFEIEIKQRDLDRLERIVDSYNKLAIQQPKMIGMLREYYDKEF